MYRITEGVTVNCVKTSGDADSTFKEENNIPIYLLQIIYQIIKTLLEAAKMVHNKNKQTNKCASNTDGLISLSNQMNLRDPQNNTACWHCLWLHTKTPW